MNSAGRRDKFVTIVLTHVVQALDRETETKREREGDGGVRREFCHQMSIWSCRYSSLKLPHYQSIWLLMLHKLSNSAKKPIIVTLPYSNQLTNTNIANMLTCTLDKCALYLLHNCFFQVLGKKVDWKYILLHITYYKLLQMSVLILWVHRFHMVGETRNSLSCSNNCSVYGRISSMTN